MDRENLKTMLDAVRNVQMTPEAKERQRRSFAYGNTHLANDHITKRMIDRAADRLEVARHESN